MLMAVLTIAGSPPNRRCHNPWLMTTTFRAPRTCSSGRNARPSAGCMPSASQKPSVTCAPNKSSGSLPPV